MYGGSCSGVFTRSISDLSVACAQSGIKLQFYFLFNESLVQRARNYCCDEFMRSDCSHLLFIDADIGFSANDVLALLAISIQTDKQYDVIGAPYPKKTISWEKIRMAVDKGIGDPQNPKEELRDPTLLERYVGDFVFNPKDGQNQIQISEPAEVREMGTGFMLIKRETLMTYAMAYPEQSYKPDHVRNEHFDGSREIVAYFDCIIDPESKRYLSEDYNFCYHAQKAGLKIWLCPWMKTQHVGSYIFGGSLIDLANIGAPATADTNMLRQPKEKKS